VLESVHRVWSYADLFDWVIQIVIYLALIPCYITSSSTVW